MAKYTFEDIEILRQKSGISYEEAVNLLEYHNGSLARALVDLEKNGRLKTGPASGDAGKGAKGVFTFLYRLRLRVRKDEAVVVNLSSLFVLLTLITAPHICVIGLIVALALGYRINIDRDSREFSSETFDSMVKNAKENVQHTVSSFAQQFSQKSPHQAAPRSSSAKYCAKARARLRQPGRKAFMEGRRAARSR